MKTVKINNFQYNVFNRTLLIALNIVNSICNEAERILTRCKYTRQEEVLQSCTRLILFVYPALLLAYYCTEATVKSVSHNCNSPDSN